VAWRFRGAVALTYVLFAPTSAWAQSLDLSLRGAVWSSDRAGTDRGEFATGEAWARARLPVNDNVRLQGEAWAEVGDRGALDADVREAEIVATFRGLELRAGRQVIAWGRADRINPTDVVGARDLRRLNVDDGDDRLGVTTVTASFADGDGVFQALWIPEFRVTEPPLAGPPNGLASVDRKPDGASRQGALRYDRSGDRFDWSLTWASLYDRTPWLGLQSAPGTAPRVTRSFPRMEMVGADTATTLGAWGVRAEAAAYWHDFAGQTPAAAYAPRLFASLGADRKFGESLDLNLQALLRLNQTLAPNGAPQPMSAGLASSNEILHGAWRKTIVGAAGRLKRELFRNQGWIEVSGAAYQGGGASLQTRLSWSPVDNWRLSLGADYFEGSRNSFFGAVNKNKSIFLEMRRGY
jgi:hypothetical protein